jgi:hypothetical protein
MDVLTVIDHPAQRLAFARLEPATGALRSDRVQGAPRTVATVITQAPDQ